MKARLLQNIIWGLGGLLMIVGLILTLRTSSALKKVSADMVLRQGAMAELSKYEDRLAPYLAAQAAYERLDPVKSEPLESLLRRTLPDVTAGDVRDLSVEATPGWIMAQKEITYSNTAIAPVMKMVEIVEAQRPPWRLAKCTIQALPGKPGSGQVLLRFEKLVRK